MIDQKIIPSITFMYREGDELAEDGGCPIGGEFAPTTTEQLFSDKKSISIQFARSVYSNLFVTASSWL